MVSILLAASLTLGFAVDEPESRPATPADDSPPIRMPVDDQRGADQFAGMPTPREVQRLSSSAAESLVIIQYVWEGEADRRELEGVGIVIDAEGLVVCPLDLVPLGLPDDQLQQFKILVPDEAGGDPAELEARLEGRDERGQVAFVRALEDHPNGSWQPVSFTDSDVAAGDWLISVGRLPEGAGYTPFTFVSRVSAVLRGPTPMIAVSGGVTSVGGVVLDTSGQAVGIVDRTGRRSPFLTGADPLAMLEQPPGLFVPTRSFEISLADPPRDGVDPALPWTGAERLTGLSKELRAYYGIGSTPAVQVGDVIADTPAARAGLRPSDVIIAFNGDELDRGDTAEEMPEIFHRQVLRTPIGEEVTLKVLDAARQEREVTLTLEERPRQPRQAQRWYARDLGFSVRELVFADRYARRLPLDTQGVAVAYVRDQSHAQAAGVRVGDLVRRVNQAAVSDLEDFQSTYGRAREEDPRAPIVLEVRRGPETQIIRIEVPQ